MERANVNRAEAKPEGDGVRRDRENADSNIA